MANVNLNAACAQHLRSVCKQMYPKSQFSDTVAEAICKHNKDLFKSSGDPFRLLANMRDVVAWATRIFEKFGPKDICDKMKVPEPVPEAEAEPIDVPVTVPFGILILAGVLACADGVLPIGDMVAASLLTVYGVNE